MGPSPPSGRVGEGALIAQTTRGRGRNARLRPADAGRRGAWALLAVVSACGATPAAGTGSVVLRGATVVGTGQADVVVDAASGLIVAVGRGAGDDALKAGAQSVEAPGRWIVPAFIDSHVHLAYHPVGDQLADGGVVAAIDLAAPEGALGLAPDEGPWVVRSGPMVTPPGGYPTQSWGKDGYGAECASPNACASVVDRLVTRGARLIKVPIGQGPDHPQKTLEAIVAAAHARGVKVAAHALTDAAAALAARVGVDALAHAPTAPLSDDTVRLWSREGRAVVSTLEAFGGRSPTIENLRRLAQGGATVLYGTDLGNTRTAAIVPDEISLLERAGLDGAAILNAATAAPAAFWGLSGLGAIAPGSQASFLVLDANPLDEPATVARPRQVWIRGRPRR